MQLFRSFISLAVLLAHFFICQQVLAFVATESATEAVLKDISILRDPSGVRSLSDILNPDIAKGFQKPTEENGQNNFGFTTDAIWVKIPLQRSVSASQTWILEVPYLGLDSVTLYSPDGSVLSVGGAQPADKTLFQRFDAFPLTLSTESQNFYLRVQSQYPISIPLVLWQVPAYSEAKLKDNFVQAAYYGGLFVLAAYNLLLYFSLRDRRYLLYVCFGLSIGMGIFSGNGYGHLFLWPNAPNWNAVSQSVFLTLSASFSLLFTKDYLSTRTTLPLCNMGLGAVALLFAIISLLFVLSSITGFDVQILYKSFSILALPATALILFACIKKILAGDRSAKFLLISFGFVWAGALVASLRSFGLLPNNGYTSYSVQIGSAFEMLAMSFALAYQINTERALRKTAEDLHKQQIRFSSFISHEFRTPLNVIESQAALLEREKANGLDNLRPRTHTIMSAVQHLSHLFTKWSQADRLQNSLTQSNPSLIALYEWLGNTIDRCREFYSTHSIELEIDPDTKIIWADKELLQIALMNLIENASKYSPTGSVIQVGTILREGMTGIYVMDNGAGIPAEHQAAIFSEYIRLDEAVNERGVGLGLAFVQKIMSLHGGNVELISQLGRGSTFTLWFPNKAAG